MNDGLIDYTDTLLSLCPELIAEGCQVILDERQFLILSAYLGRISGLGDDINFRLERCIDHRPGYSFAWDNGGSLDQDRAVDKLMDDLVQALGLDADSVEKTPWFSGHFDIALVANGA